MIVAAPSHGLEEAAAANTLAKTKEQDDDISDLISLPSITLTNDELAKWSQTHQQKLEQEHQKQQQQQQQQLHHLISRSDTMTSTFSILDEEDESAEVDNIEVNDDDGELDEEIVQRNLSFCRGDYVKEFKKKWPRLLSPQITESKQTRIDVNAPKCSEHTSPTRPRLIIQEEHIEETTKTCKK